ncbi:Voltage-dependent calcium channel subunit alpha-2/delta-3 [Liparis tanakae]|uniref:Voltage-dependent calcium channel subunit alpha-2/delta-3 n=1 Tax=Liparis tanakae TaxID=230148 RepID=A0A4Z2FW99_9TELE|nr:Voltage-dependent calcium channel subunit alpha-2/delta-3 [Liparis tanakae]
MTLDLIESIFWAITSQPNDTDCSDTDGVCPLQCDRFDIACYVIDNNGFVLISKQRQDPFYGLASVLKWFLSNFLMFLLEFNICGFWHTEHFADASTHKKRGDNLQPCDTEYPSFVYEPSVKETNSIIKCGRCQKMFVVQQIPESNLLMLVVQADCDCSRQYAPITMAPEEVKYIL